jgi:RecA-family ATPase
LLLIGDSGVGKSCLLLRFAVSAVILAAIGASLCHVVPDGEKNVIGLGGGLIMWYIV